MHSGARQFREEAHMKNAIIGLMMIGALPAAAAAHELSRIHN
jgi:hypothetical protein